VWYRHWGLSRHPFNGADSPYISLPSHDEALYRLVYSIEQGHRLVIFRAEAGLGKTTVLRRAIAESRSPRREVVLVRPTADGLQVPGLIAERLGLPGRHESGRDPMWQAMVRSLRVASLEGFHVILAIDDEGEDSASTIVRNLVVTARAGCEYEARLTIIRVGRPISEPRFEPEDGWPLAIRLQRLTRSQVEQYLVAKLTAAGSSERVFTPRAVTRLHGLSAGIPRGLEQLAGMSLMAGAVRGLEVIPPDVVDGVARECRESDSISSVYGSDGG
jgi:type II secretory pathway predicted ATPase ExeA